MNRVILLAAIGLLCLTSCSQSDKDKALKALYITGGCCHDYDFQKATLTAAISQRTNVEWTIAHEGGDSKDFQSKLYNDPNWASQYDVVIHNECFANTSDPGYIAKIVDAHKAGTPAVVIHCAMHTYRASDSDLWREFLGVTSRRHDHQSHYPVVVVEPKHPIMTDFPSDWVSPMDELYIIEKLWPGATALATGKSEESGDSHPVFWTNEYARTRVFGTTFGHTNETISDPHFQEIVTRGMLWAAGRL